MIEVDVCGNGIDRTMHANNYIATNLTLYLVIVFDISHPSLLAILRVCEDQVILYLLTGLL